MGFLNNLVCTICYAYMKRADPKWTKEAEERAKNRPRNTDFERSDFKL